MRTAPSPAPRGGKPILVLAVGNPSRGDDAVGPRLAERLEALGLPDVDVLVDYQLQVEHALDLVQRERVVFLDAAVGTHGEVTVRAVGADAGFACTSHALAPAQVLETYRRVTGCEPPEAWLVGVSGERFELGGDVSPAATRACEVAWPRLLELCRRPTRRTTDAPARTGPSSPP